MKNLKYIVITLILLPVIASMFIITKHSEVLASENKWYLKGTTGMNYTPFQEIKENRLTGSLKLKQEFPVVGIGVGYKFDNDIRIETMFDYYFMFTQLEKSKIDDETFNININNKISDLMISGIKDIRITKNTNFFIGGGLGVSSIYDEANGYKKDELFDYCELLEPIKGKHIYRFAYKFTTGFDTKLRDGLIGEISYNYYNLGKSRAVANDNIEAIQSRTFIIHNLILGLRLEL